jgi:hypothetical protein
LVNNAAIAWKGDIDVLINNGIDVVNPEVVEATFATVKIRSITELLWNHPIERGYHPSSE